MPQAVNVNTGELLHSLYRCPKSRIHLVEIQLLAAATALMDRPAELCDLFINWVAIHAQANRFEEASTVLIDAMNFGVEWGQAQRAELMAVRGGLVHMVLHRSPSGDLIAV